MPGVVERHRTGDERQPQVAAPNRSCCHQAFSHRPPERSTEVFSREIAADQGNIPTIGFLLHSLVRPITPDSRAAKAVSKSSDSTLAPARRPFVRNNAGTP